MSEIAPLKSEKALWPTFTSTPDIVAPCPGYIIMVRDNPLPTKKILVPESAKEQAAQREVMATGFVVACGAPGLLSNGTELPCPVKPGDHVLTARASLTTHRGKDRNGEEVLYEAIQFHLVAGVIEDPVGDAPPPIVFPD